MNNMQNIQVEQLWYTWSDVGLSSVHAGLRIRAASPGLTEIYSARVKSMDRYMRYALPPGTNHGTITPETAPVGLAYLRTDWNNEYILVHKNYSGKDGVGRPGNFFVHILALGPSSQISIEDAIWLWNADLWRTNDQEQERRSTTLDTFPIAELILEDNPHFHLQFAQVQQALAFFIEAYLSRKGRTPIYIAAPAHQSGMIASLIAGLALCLPQPLQADLTFSTYEPDITKATTEIIGTSWIATPGKERDASDVIPAHWYRDHLAVNCVTGEHSQLQGHPLASYNPLAADFAAYATDCLVTNTTEKLYKLCTDAEQNAAITITGFLQNYNEEIAHPDNIGEEGIENSLKDPTRYLDRLSSQTFRKQIIDHVLINPPWATSRLKPLLLSLRERAGQEYSTSFNPNPNMLTYSTTEYEQLPRSAAQNVQKRKRANKASTQTKKSQLTLTDALSLLAKRAIQEIVDTMKQTARTKGTPIDANTLDTLERQQIIGLITLMESCLLAQDPNQIWKQLFSDILASRSATDYLKAQWDIRFRLLQLWDKAFPVNDDYDNVLRPLVIVPWNRFGTFLKFSLNAHHKQWNFFALEKLLVDQSLTPQVCIELEQIYAQEINNIFILLLQERQLLLASGLMKKLVENNYRVRPPLDARIDQLLTLLQNSSQVSPHVARDLIIALTHAGHKGTASYQNSVEILLNTLFSIDQGAGYELLDLLVMNKYPRKKALVDIALRSGRGYLSSENITKIFARIYQTPEELNTFFLHDGANYLASREQITAMLSLYQTLLQYFPHSEKLERLFVLLDTLLDENTISSILNATRLDGYEPARVLERYGRQYLQESPTYLGNNVVNWFATLIQTGYPDVLQLLLALWTPSADYKHLEHLLTAAHLSLADSQVFLTQYGTRADCASFFQQSAATLALFSRLAQAANSYAGSPQGQHLAAEKMALLFTWMDPDAPPLFNDVEKILQAASLVPAEQIAFLERYGPSYLLLFPQLTPSLAKYIGTYIESFNTDRLEEEHTRRFLAVLIQNYKRLHLDSSILTRIQDWAIIENYCSLPTIYPETLSSFIGALLRLGLPNNERFTEKLAKIFVSCITTYKDLDLITGLLQNTKVKDNMLRFLYTIAERVAENFREQRLSKILLPYLVFALVWNGPGVTKHFLQEFLDTLLYHVDVVTLSHWKILNDQLTLQGLPHDAMKRWEFYLEKLELLSRLNTPEENDAGTAESTSKASLKRPGKTKKSVQQTKTKEQKALAIGSPTVKSLQEQQAAQGGKKLYYEEDGEDRRRS